MLRIWNLFDTSLEGCTGVAIDSRRMKMMKKVILIRFKMNRMTMTCLMDVVEGCICFVREKIMVHKTTMTNLALMFVTLMRTGLKRKISEAYKEIDRQNNQMLSEEILKIIDGNGNRDVDYWAMRSSISLDCYCTTG